MVKSVVLSWGKGRNQVAKVAAVKLLVMWVLVRGKVIVVKDLLVVVWRRVAGLGDVAGLSVLAIWLGTARRRILLGEQQIPNWDVVEGCL